MSRVFRCQPGRKDCAEYKDGYKHHSDGCQRVVEMDERGSEEGELMAEKDSNFTNSSNGGGGAGGRFQMTMVVDGSGSAKRFQCVSKGNFLLQSLTEVIPGSCAT